MKLEQHRRKHGGNARIIKKNVGICKNTRERNSVKDKYKVLAANPCNVPVKKTNIVDNQPQFAPSSSPLTMIKSESRIYFREKEINIIKNYFENHNNRSMYISGPTGTGKTFTVQHFFSSISHLHRFELLNLNCVLFKMEKDILRFIFDKLTKANKQPNVSNLLECIENVFSNAEIPIIIVLDEIDYMKSKNNSFLYKFFEWPTKYSQVACIGISNSLDLTERILPKLKLSHSPVRVIFSPYTRIEIQQILVNKLSHIGEVDMQAIELCSRKIASMTGDIRFALQIGRQMLFSSNEKENKYCERVLGTLSNIYDSPILRIRLPIQQKIILAVMLNLSQKYSTTAINKDLFEKSYHNGCKKLSVVSMNANDLSSSLLLLESQSVIQIKSSHYQLLIDAGTAAKIISDSTLISQFFLN